MRRALIAALAAGFAACIAVTAAQQAVVVPLILKAEEFEEANAAKAAPAAAAAQPQAAHQHEQEGWKPGDGIERIAYTALANLGFGVGFGLLLVAGFTLAGRAVDWKRGLLWGAAGFAVFALAPALGLPPELPGTASAALPARQAWWLSTAAATAAGLGLIAFGKGWPWKALGVLALVAPHVIGAPHPPADPIAGHGAGGVPADIAAGFVALSLAVTALFWAVLGAVSGAVYTRVR
ncbi:MAG: CbtA family protein [Rhodospirillales bacterium]